MRGRQRSTYGVEFEGGMECSSFGDDLDVRGCYH